MADGDVNLKYETFSDLLNLILNLLSNLQNNLSNTSGNFGWNLVHALKPVNKILSLYIMNDLTENHSEV